MESELYHILFIDDDEDFLHSMNMAVSSRRLTQDNGVHVETHYVSDPQEGLTFAKELTEEKEKIAVIVSDQQMPVLTGIEFMEKASSIVPNAIKVLLTGYASLDSAKYAINNHILDQYVSKPIEDYDNFISLIKNAIGTFHLREEKEQAEEEIRKYVKELEQRNEKIRSMHLAAEKIAYLAQGFRKLDLDEVLDLIITRIPDVFKAKYASLFLLDEEDNSLQMVRSNYLRCAYEKHLDVDDQSPMMVAMRENSTIVLSQIQEASYKFLDKEMLGDSCIIIPFIIGNEHSTPGILENVSGVKGVLNMGNITEMGSEDIIKYAASLIRNILGINIMNARLYQRTQRLALTDGLTGLYNKHVFMEFLRKDCAASERHGDVLYLALLDADDFKSINDTYGHRIGDEVLSLFGRLCQNAARKADTFARFGGEEFAWLIHGGEETHIISLLDRFREGVCSSEFPNGLRMSISIGLTRYYPQSDDNLDKFIDRADKALYRAKEKGKNRVEVSFRDDRK